MVGVLLMSTTIVKKLVPDIVPGQFYRLTWEVEMAKGFPAHAPLWKKRNRDPFTPSSSKDIVGFVFPGDTIFVVDVDFNVLGNQFTVKMMTDRGEMGWMYCGTSASKPDVIDKLYAMFVLVTAESMVLEE